jgi:thioredoxin
MTRTLWIFPLLLSLAACDKLRETGARIAKQASAATSEKTTGAAVSEITAGEFDSFRLQRDKVVIVDFHAPWCGPCRQLGPLLEKIAAESQGAVVVGKINVDDHRELATQEGVSGIPDMRIYRNGALVDKLVGLPPEPELRERIRGHTAALAATPTADGGTQAKEPAIQPMSKDWLPPGIQRR